MLEVGRITRPHGLRGEVGVLLVSNRPERVAPGAVLHTPEQTLTVRAARPHKSGFIVAFEECRDRDDAEALRDTVLSAESIDDPEELWVHELVGAVVVDQSGVERGTVGRVVANPASDLLELDSGALVPVRFVTSLRPGVRVDVEVPDGLFDLDTEDDEDGTGS